MESSTLRGPAGCRALIALAALLLSGAVAAPAQAVPLSGSDAPLPGSSFQGGDGNQATPLLGDPDYVAVNPRKDWQDFAATAGHTPDPQADDDIFKGGSKENEPGKWAFTTKDGGSTPGKDNVLDAYSLTDPVSNDTFLYLAFTRLRPDGTTYLAFELNKRGELWNNGSADIPCRTTGDLLVAIEVAAHDPDVVLQKWSTATADAATGCAKTGSLSDFSAFADNVDAQGAVSDAPITNYLPSSFAWPGDTIPSALFGEAALNLSALLPDVLGESCFSFGSIWMHTRSSSADDPHDRSNMQDYVSPRPLSVGNCSASGTKFHDLDADGVRDAGEPGLAGFRIWADYDNDGVRDAGEPFDDTAADGGYTITGIQDPSGTYSLREQLTPPATGTGGWICSKPSATGPNGDFPCAYTGIDQAKKPHATRKDFGNYKHATVKVEKQTVPDGAAGSFGFGFVGEPGFSLADGEVQTFTVAPGTYTATEAAQSDYTLTDVGCSGDSDSSGDKAARTATFRAQSGETIKCVFTNSLHKGKLTVVKKLISDDPKESGQFALKIGQETVATGGDGASGSRDLEPGSYTVSEAGADGTLLAAYDSSIACDNGQSGAGSSLPGVHVDPDDDITCTITNEAKLNPAIAVDKKIRNGSTGPFVDTPPDVEAYVGDTLQYQFTVTNPGDVALAVTLADPRCNAGTLSGPTGTGTADGLLDPGEAWVYTCSHVVTAGDPDPLPNTVTATGSVPGRPPVSDKDSAEADILHPAIDIEKTGPATATAGDVLSYELAVTNPGDVQFASDKVVVTDPGCDDQPTLVRKNGDATPAFLDPGDNWTYACSHATAAGQTSFLNVAKVTATDRNGRPVTDVDDLPTTLKQPQSGNLPEEIISGRARLRGPSGCVKRRFKATVRGRRIASVTFFVDGKRVKRISGKGGARKRFTVKVNPKGRGFGVHRVSARVKFVKASRTRTRTLRLSFQRCRRQVVTPRFTG